MLYGDEKGRRMSKLLKVTEDEYQIIRQFYDAVATVVENTPNRDYLPLFAEEIRKDLDNIITLYHDKNNLKRKYYAAREKLKKGNNNEK
jgi:hypothetical protein